MYLSTINEYIILVEFGSNSFNATCDLMQMFIFQKKYLWIEMFKMNDIIVKKAQSKQQVEQPFVGHLKKHYLTFEFLYCIYIICDAFFYERM
jgi:hypothetical protein